MSAITFDTLKFVEKLKSAGIPEAQAKAEAEALTDALAESSAYALATKLDIARLEMKLAEHDGEFKLLRWMLGLVLGGILALILKAFFPMA